CRRPEPWCGEFALPVETPELPESQTKVCEDITKSLSQGYPGIGIGDWESSRLLLWPGRLSHADQEP
ncbi:MAG: hypothetical protein VX532_02770, partial [Cyanobacteriota bacterium]|nr:hypothetical protein [Cyanobacteriota bacterium]